MKRLALLVLLSPVLMADICGDDPSNPCLHPPPGIGNVVTTAQAADDPCTGQGKDHIVAWFDQGGVRYPLRCGVRDDPRGRGGYGYVHIRYDSPPQDTTGHGDAVNDPAFVAEIMTTLAHGQEGHVGGGTWAVHAGVPSTEGVVHEVVGLPGGAGEAAEPAGRASHGHHHRAAVHRRPGREPIIREAMQNAVDARWSAADLVERLRHDWLGTLNWGPVTLDDISLQSAGVAWPPVIRLDFRSQNERYRWEDAWGHLEGMTLEVASNLWLGIVHAHMCEAGLL